MSKRERKNRRAVAAYAANILALYLDAPEVTRAAGREWYAAEGAMLRELARKIGRGEDATIAAAAAISPGMRWEFIAAHIAALSKNPAHKVPTYSREFVRRASVCLRGGDPDTELGGDKVRAFYACLRAGGACQDVVVDGHAINLARGEVANIRKLPAAGRVTRARYRRAAEAYREVAELVGEHPSTVQAATWIHWRNMLDEARRAT